MENRPPLFFYCCRCSGLELALSGHANDAKQCLLSGAKRTWPKDGVMSGYDPQETLAGLKSCSAAISCGADECYLSIGSTGVAALWQIFDAMPALIRGRTA